MRKALSKKTRFEVFKRDSFTCQYCGGKAPDVLLHVDHIRPVAAGGDNSLMNLVAACASCNSGKGATALSDGSAVAKARRQIEELQARREQIELMMEWQSGLAGLKDETADSVAALWHNRAIGWTANETGKQAIRKWLRTYSVEELAQAIDAASTQYLVFSKSGKATKDSVGVAFKMIPAIARLSRATIADPELKDVYYARGILRKRLEGRYFDNAQSLADLKTARSYGVPVGVLREITLQARHWTDFHSLLSDAIEDYGSAPA